MKKISLFILLALVVACKTDTKEPEPAVDVQTFKITADGKSSQLNITEDVIVSSYGSPTLSLSAMSEKNDLSFTVLAHVPALEKGAYKAYSCALPYECGPTERANEGQALYQPYPDGSLDVTTTRTAYLAPSLNLQPLIVSIKEVKNEQQAGNPRKTKFVTGSFSGTLAYVEQQPDNTWKVVKTTSVSGDFKLYCSLY
jgi:hypothetical protein